MGLCLIVVENKQVVPKLSYTFGNINSVLNPLVVFTIQSNKL